VRFRTDVRIPLHAGRNRVLQLRGRQQDDPQGAARIEASVQDVTERWKTARRIRYLSLHDSLTGLGNREYFLQHLRGQLKHAETTGASLAVMAIGVHDLASITGTMGHSVADDLLCEMGRRVADELSPTVSGRAPSADGLEGMAMRLGGAELGTVVNVRTRNEAASWAKRILHRLSEGYRLGDEDITVSTSVGISLWPDDGGEVEALVRNCHAALQQAKLAGCDRYQFYRGAMHKEAARRLRMANRLRRAIEQDELDVYYQPRVRPASATVVAVEALARWNSDEFGQVPPSEFIPLAEDAGLVQQLGNWCLRAASNDLARWRELGASDLRVAVNISRLQLARGIVKDILKATSAVDPTALELEVTESALIENPEEALAVLTELGEYGFRISLDDFGTGYSSLSYIRQLPIDAVKIDRSFISELATSEDAHSITWAIIMMCQALNLEAVAEGVETKAQRRKLIDLGCDEAQGFLFAHPMSAARLEQFLEKNDIFGSERTVA
jgi:diguanylate cyclase (GGDEF)-like protein